MMREKLTKYLQTIDQLMRASFLEKLCKFYLSLYYCTHLCECSKSIKRNTIFFLTALTLGKNNRSYEVSNYLHSESKLRAFEMQRINQRPIKYIIAFKSAGARNFTERFKHLDIMRFRHSANLFKQFKELKNGNV